MPSPRRAHPFNVQFHDLLRIELTNWRWTWRAMVVLGTAAPFGSIVVLRLLLGDGDPDVLAHVFAGNLALSLVFDVQMRVGNHFQFMRFHGTLDYFAALQVRRSALVLAVAGAFFILSLPSLAVLVAIGPRVLELSLQPSPLLLLVVPLSTLPLTGIGAFVGIVARSPAEATSLSMLIAVCLGSGAVIPPHLLPAWAAALTQLSPATHAASALRSTLVGPLAAELWVNLAVLSLFALVTLWAVAGKLDWRGA